MERFETSKMKLVFGNASADDGSSIPFSHAVDQSLLHEHFSKDSHNNNSSKIEIPAFI